MSRIVIVILIYSRHKSIDHKKNNSFFHFFSVHFVYPLLLIFTMLCIYALFNYALISLNIVLLNFRKINQ
jgi:cell division protein FtsW (lipid II flippase)